MDTTTRLCGPTALLLMAAFCWTSVVGEHLSQNPPEAKNRLARLFDKIDVSGDEKIDKNELVAWMELVFKWSEKRAATRLLDKIDSNRDGLVTLDEYLTNTFGYRPPEIEAMKTDTSVEAKNFLESIEEERAKFICADGNKDGALDTAELAAFNAPFHYPHMVEYAASETIRYQDSDGDGRLSQREYIGETSDFKVVDYEKARFEAIDIDGDGFVDIDELMLHYKDEAMKYAILEANHLLLESDSNKDSLISRGEIAEAYMTWLESHATGQGQLLDDENLSRPAPHKSLKDEL